MKTFPVTSEVRTFQIGASAGETCEQSVGTSSVSRLRSLVILDCGPAAPDVFASLSNVDAFSKLYVQARTIVGAKQNRLEHHLNTVNVQIENITASESTIRDTDTAAETTRLTENRILAETGTTSWNVLTLLRG